MEATENIFQMFSRIGGLQDARLAPGSGDVRQG
jgi:hypothetical protein